MANTAKPAFDVKAHNEALAHFREELEEHEWSFQSDSYHTLIEAHNKEVEFFKTAMRLGIQGVDEFVYVRNQAIQQIRDAEFERGAAWQKRMSDGNIEYYKKQLEETRAKYMKPMDFFKEKLNKHDWYYSFSDDLSVYKSGRAAEEALLKEAQELGPEFVKEFEATLQRVTDNIRKK